MRCLPCAAAATADEGMVSDAKAGVESPVPDETDVYAFKEGEVNADRPRRGVSSAGPSVWGTKSTSVEPPKSHAKLWIGLGVGTTIFIIVMTIALSIGRPSTTSSSGNNPSPMSTPSPQIPDTPIAGIDASALRQCHVDAGGTISDDQETRLAFGGTERHGFKLRGEIFLGGNDEAGGALFCFRETDGMHRYELTGQGVRAKRVLLAGKQVAMFANPVKLGTPHGVWVAFSFEVTEKKMVTTFGNQTGTVAGPLSMDGTNSVLLRPGGKLRALQLDISK